MKMDGWEEMGWRKEWAGVRSQQHKRFTLLKLSESGGVKLECHNKQHFI